MRYCTHCGKEISEEAAICLNCGCVEQPELLNPARSAKPKVPDKTISVIAFILAMVGMFLTVTCYIFLFTENYVLWSIGLMFIFYGGIIVYGCLIASVVCSIVALVKIKAGTAKGNGFAISAIVIGAVMLVAAVALFFLYIFTPIIYL